MLEVGKFAFDTANSANVQILEKIEAWGDISYRVFNPATSAVYKVPVEQLKEDSRMNICKRNRDSRPDSSSGVGGIRTLVPRRANAFRVRPVMTTSIQLRTHMIIICILLNVHYFSKNFFYSGSGYIHDTRLKIYEGSLKTGKKGI